MSKLLQLTDIDKILVDPITKEHLLFKEKYLLNQISGGKFPFIGNIKSPLLFPQEILPYCNDSNLDWIGLINTKVPLNQYIGISYIKWNGGAHNSSPDEECYKKYLNDFETLVADAKGMLLDIGCDDPQNTILRFPDHVDYLGIDPLYYLPSPSFKIFAVSEFLPFTNNTFDCVCFGTSLDHTFDPYTALMEAARVLKQNGILYLSTLVWSKNAELYKDNVHFHHFRESHILELIDPKQFSIKKLFKSSWKNDLHREGMFLKAVRL